MQNIKSAEHWLLKLLELNNFQDHSGLETIKAADGQGEGTLRTVWQYMAEPETNNHLHLDPYLWSIFTVNLYNQTVWFWTVERVPGDKPYKEIINIIKLKMK